MATESERPTFFQIQLRSLAFLGFDITKEKSTVNRLFGTFNCISAILFLFLFLPQLMLSHGSDLHELCLLIGIIVGVFLAVIKMSAIHCQPKDFMDLNVLIKDLYMSVGLNDRKKLMDVNRLAQLLSSVNLVCVLSSSIILILYPLGLAIEQFYVTGTFSWPHPFMVVIPFVDTSTTPVHELIHLILTYNFIIASFAICAADSLFVESCLLLTKHFLLLQRNIENLNYDDVDEELRKIFTYHRNILKTKGALQKSYQRILTFFLLLVHVMFGVFVLSAIQSSGLTVFKSLGYAFSTLCQIFFYTYGGDIITRESQKICGSYFNSKWFEATPKKRKEVLTAMIISQGGTVLRGGLVDLNLRTTARVNQQ